MNNSLIGYKASGLEEQSVDKSPLLREQAIELATIIEAFDHISQSTYWNVLQKEIFGQVLGNLQRRLNKEKDTTEIFRLQGQIEWAEKYCDFNKLSEEYRSRLLNIKRQIDE